MSLPIERIYNNENLESFDALVTGVKKTHHILLESDKDVREQVYIFHSIIGENLSTTKPISSMKNVLFINCPQLGDIQSNGKVILINCKIHGKVTAGGDIHACDSNIENLFPGSGQKLYIYTSKHKDVPLCVDNFKLRDASLWDNEEVHKQVH